MDILRQIAKAYAAMGRWLRTGRDHHLKAWLDAEVNLQMAQVFAASRLENSTRKPVSDVEGENGHVSLHNRQ